MKFILEDDVAPYNSCLLALSKETSTSVLINKSAYLDKDLELFLGDKEGPIISYHLYQGRL